MHPLNPALPRIILFRTLEVTTRIRTKIFINKSISFVVLGPPGLGARGRCPLCSPTLSCGTGLFYTSYSNSGVIFLSETTPYTCLYGVILYKPTDSAAIFKYGAYRSFISLPVELRPFSFVSPCPIYVKSTHHTLKSFVNTFLRGRGQGWKTTPVPRPLRDETSCAASKFIP